MEDKNSINDGVDQEPKTQSSTEAEEKLPLSNAPPATALVGDDFTTVVFGPSMIHDLTNCLQTSITNAISEAVSSLPLLGSASDEETTNTTVTLSGYHKLLQRLQLVYMSNLDRFVVYARRNIFSVPPGINKGSNKVQILSDILLRTSSSTNNKIASQTEMSATYPETLRQPTEEGLALPTIEQIPGNDQMKTLDQELEQARSTLRSIKEQRKTLRSHLDSMNIALHLSEASTRGIKRILVEDDGATIHDTVKKIITDKEELATIQREGKVLSNKLDNLKQSSSQNSSSSHDLQHSTNSKKCTLVDSSKSLVEERCEAFRTQKIRTDEVTNLASLLKKKK